MAKTLYICYFGIREPLVQTQVLPYLRELLKDGHVMSLLTFEPLPGDGEKGRKGDEEIKAELAADGIEWHWLRYHKRPSALATAYDIFRGAWFVRGMIDRKGLDILHGRVHVPTLMGAMARRFSRRKPKLLFDIRGFMPEEYTDAGVWPGNGRLFRSVKRIEEWLMKESHGFVVLTEKARTLLFNEDESRSNGRPVEVIPCCVDLEKRFSIDRCVLRKKTRSELGIEDRFVFVHAGALGGLYLTETIADLLGTARRRDPRTFAMFLTQSNPELIVPLLRKKGFEGNDYFVGRVSPEEIPRYLCSADAGLSFVKASYSTQSRSPTKIPEYLACGLPLIANRGVGDVDELITQNGIGILIDELDDEGYLQCIDKLSELGNVSEECRRVAESGFAMASVGGPRYRRLYSKLVESAK